ncbi:substrate-binding domain-containing protein [Pseudoflavonifractor sp. BIOML-A1]|nr:LacI family DNA-binding transcriptional regulator [Pseudoflavonifractor sp. BIOML-A1]MTS93837.1 substrate-binding domain-containing protein [Pseudoflavonifractor sp. BIOML-A1]
MATIKQIAELAGVSRGTVDRVLNNRPGVKPDTAELIRKIAAEVNYRPDLAGKILAARKKNLRLGFLTLEGDEFTFFHDVTQAARKKAVELQNLGVEVRFYMVREFTRSGLEALAAQVEGDQLDGMAMVPMMTPAIISLMHTLEARGTPIIFFNIDEPSVKRLCYVGCDYLRAGRVAAGLAALTTGGRGTVGLLTLHDSDNYSYQERALGFTRELSERYPAMTLLNGGAPTIFQHGDYSAVHTLFREHPELDAIYIVNLGDFSVCREARIAAGERPLSIITNDLVAAQREMLQSGVISATLGQQPEVQGALPLQLLYQALAFGEAPGADKLYTDLNIYISQNI